jgi:predicted Na+-dependent transporter
MQIFEFVLVMASLVLAIGFTSLLSVVATIISRRHAHALSWYPLIWIATLFLYVPGYWWSLWDFREVEWTFPSYFYLLLMPTFLYIAMRLLGEALVPEDGRSKAETFEQVRMPFFLALILTQIAGAVDGWLLSVAPLVNSLRVVQVLLIVLYAVGALTANVTVQKVVAAANFVLMVVAMFGLRYLPGAFSG